MDRSLIKDALRPLKYVNAQGEVKELDPKAILKFDNNNIPFETTPNIYFFISRLAERKRLEAKDLSSQLDALRGSLYIKFVKDPNLTALNNGRKPPENMLNTAIESDAQYVALSKEANEADYYARTLNWLLKAIEMKANMMQSVSANQREQLKMTPRGTANEI